MKKVELNGVTLAYETYGTGPSIALTAYGWMEPGSKMRLLAEELASDYNVLIWDRRNSGGSGVAVTGEKPEWEVFADDLHSLLDHLGMLPAIIGGCSGGGIVSEVFAYKYPVSTRALLILNTPVDSPELFASFGKSRYLEPARLAEEGGMAGVLDAGDNPWSNLAKNSPEHMDALKSLDPMAFAAVLRSWATVPEKGLAHFGGLTEEQLKTIQAPTLVVTGIEENHPRETGDQLAAMLPNVTLRYAEDVFTESHIEEFLKWIEEDYATGVPRHVLGHAPAIREFLSTNNL